MQSVGVMPLDVGSLPPAMVAFGCHKGLLVPQGLGVLYASRSLPICGPPISHSRVSPIRQAISSPATKTWS